MEKKIERPFKDGDFYFDDVLHFSLVLYTKRIRKFSFAFLREMI
jgi:hypothetical protein